jgi:hypothetical protein
MTKTAVINALRENFKIGDKEIAALIKKLYDEAMEGDMRSAVEFLKFVKLLFEVGETDDEERRFLANINLEGFDEP